MLEKLLDIFGTTRDKEIVNAILGFFTIMLSNLSRQPSLNYILSHGVVTCLTMTKFGNMNNEIADYYINFLKVLSRKITSSNLHIFYHEVNIILKSDIQLSPFSVKQPGFLIIQKVSFEQLVETSFYPLQN